jgi:hypothetical protein
VAVSIFNALIFQGIAFKKRGLRNDEHNGKYIG